VTELSEVDELSVAELPLSSSFVIAPLSVVTGVVIVGVYSLLDDTEEERASPETST